LQTQFALDGKKADEKWCNIYNWRC
jgi:hypothetical protein